MLKKIKRKFKKITFYYLYHHILKIYLNNLFNKYIVQFLSDIFIIIPFIPKKTRFLRCSTKSIYKLNDKKVKYSFLANDKGDLGNIMLEDFHIYKDDNNYLQKISYSLSYRRYPHASLQKLIEILDTGNYDVNDYKRFIVYLASPYGAYGDVDNFERLLIYLKVKLDNLSDRKMGQYNESTYMTAIGHMTELVYAFKAIENKIIDITKNKFKIVIAKPYQGAKDYCIANNEFSKILITKAEKLGLEIVFSDKFYVDLEPDIELWPNAFLNSYSFYRHIYGYSNLFWDNNNFGKKIIWPFSYQIDTAKEIILKYFGKIPSSFVGIHMRTSKDNEILRNANPVIFQRAIDLVNKAGFYCFLIGQNSDYSDIKKTKRIFDTTNISLTQYQRECLQIYIWSHSRFFIGSNSGGTNPPGNFEVPIIWLDCFPIYNNRKPSVKDHILPKRIYSLKLGRFLNLDELFDSTRYWESQPLHEDHLHFNEKGYKLYSCSLDKLELCIKDMIIKTKNIRREVNQKESNFLGSELNKDEFRKYKYGGKFYY